MAPTRTASDAASLSLSAYDTMIDSFASSHSTPSLPVIAQTFQANADGLQTVAYRQNPPSESPTIEVPHLAKNERVLDHTDTESTYASDHTIALVGGHPVPMNLGGEPTRLLGKRRLFEEAQSILVDTPEPTAEIAETAVSERDDEDAGTSAAEKDGSVEPSSAADFFAQKQLEVLQHIEVHLAFYSLIILGLLGAMILISIDILFSLLFRRR